MSNASADRFPFVLDSLPRTGSTTLTQLLNTHPDITCCMEPFHPRRYGGHFNKMALNNGSLEEALRVIRLRWNGLKHVREVHTGWPFVGKGYLNDGLLASARVIVSLERRNLLQQYVSAYISKHLGFWVGTKAEFLRRLQYSMLPSLDVEQVNKELKEIRNDRERRAAISETLSAKRVVLCYEELFGPHIAETEQIGLINKLLSDIGHSAITDNSILEKWRVLLDATTYKWADNDVYAFLPNALSVHKHCSSDETGFLFS